MILGDPLWRLVIPDDPDVPEYWEEMRVTKVTKRYTWVGQVKLDRKLLDAGGKQYVEDCGLICTAAGRADTAAYRDEDRHRIEELRRYKAEKKRRREQAAKEAEERRAREAREAEERRAREAREAEERRARWARDAAERNRRWDQDEAARRAKYERQEKDRREREAREKLEAAEFEQRERGTFHLLGLSCPETIADIKKAFNRKALVAHPDHGGTNDAIRALIEEKEAAISWIGYRDHGAFRRAA